ncbi:hypothetical protein Tco_1491044 [Tanacetum coccineum]
MQLNSTINHNKIMVEEVKSLKTNFQQKENKYLEEFLDMKALKEKVEDRLFKQDQSVQTVHMLCKPKPYYDDQRKVAIGYENPLYLTRALQVQPALYNGHEILRFSDMHDAFAAAQKRIAELESENSNLKNKIQNDDHDVMIKYFSRLEVEHLNLQLEYQHLKERFRNKKSMTSSDAPISILDLKALDSQNKDLKAKVNALHDLNERFREENEKVKHHYMELYDSIKITRAKTIEKTNSLLNEIENLKAQIKGKSKCVTMPAEKPKVLAPGMYAIDVEPIPPRNKNNREVHLDYLKHLKESVETLREIVEEARVKDL